MNPDFTPPPWYAALQQSLSATRGDYASLSRAGFPAFDPAALTASYQRLFMPLHATPTPTPTPTVGSAGVWRLQRATQAIAQLATGVAADATARFQAALAATDPALPKITSLRALYELWIDCGEAAHAAAAHSSAWAQAQAELLNALVELRAESAGAR